MQTHYLRFVKECYTLFRGVIFRFFPSEGTYFSLYRQGISWCYVPLFLTPPDGFYKIFSVHQFLQWAGGFVKKGSFKPYWTLFLLNPTKTISTPNTLFYPQKCHHKIDFTPKKSFVYPQENFYSLKIYLKNLPQFFWQTTFLFKTPHPLVYNKLVSGGGFIN